MSKDRVDREAPEAQARSLLVGLQHKTLVTKEDVSSLRSLDGMFGLMSPEIVAALIAIERGTADTCAEWGNFLIETVLDCVIWGERPTGVVTDQQAASLLVQVGDTPTPTCMALLITVLEEAHTVPDWFKSAVRGRAVNVLAGLDPAQRHAA